MFAYNCNIYYILNCREYKCVYVVLGGLYKLNSTSQQGEYMAKRSRKSARKSTKKRKTKRATARRSRKARR